MLEADGEDGPRRRLAVFTICSNNYLSFARVLFASIRRQHPEAELFLCLADQALDLPGLYEADYTLIEARALSIPDFESMAFRYDIMEFNTALKPFMALHLLEQLGFDDVLYFDPDIELFAPVATVLGALRSGASFVLTPHLCSPSEDRREPNDLTILRAGTYNLGFLGVSRTTETLDLIRWWARRLRTLCIDSQSDGLFVDQKFINLVPCFASHAKVCRDTSLNVAYWNLGERRLEQRDGGWWVDGAPLVFFHFSGFNPAEPTRLSKHDPRFVGNLPPALAELTRRYAEQLEREGHSSTAALPYAYGRFSSGASIGREVRIAFRDAGSWKGNPFDGWGETAEPTNAEE